LSMDQEYKYTAIFDSVVHASNGLEASNISEASLEALRPLIPESVSLDRNIDLVGLAFNAAVVNKFNRNGDGIDSNTAVAIKDYFIHKPTNIEHDRERVVGHIVSAAFSKLGETNELISPEEAFATDGAYNISLGAVVYKTVSKEFSDLVLQSTDKDSDYYQTVSASWEVGFNDYVIALGGDDVGEAIIISNEEEIENYTPYLKAFGGKGKLQDGTEVNRLIVGDIYPLGIGFTSNPAADVKGVFVEGDYPKEKPAPNESIDKIIIKSEKISHSKNDNVLTEEHKNYLNTMETEQLIKEFRATLDEKLTQKEFSEEAVANMTKVFSDAIKVKSEEYSAKLEQANAEKEDAEEAHNSLKDKVSEVEEQLKSTEEKLSSLEQENSSREAEVRFNSRMEALDEVYQLDDEDRKILASEVSDLDDAEDSFAVYQEKLATIWKHKNKERISALATEMEEKISAEVEKRLAELKDSKAGEKTEELKETSEATEEALDNVKAEDAAVTNNNAEVAEEPSLRERFAKTFKDSVTISF
jgi:hypothetical protein